MAVAEARAAAAAEDGGCGGGDGSGFPVGMRVLVVDDDRTCLLVLQQMLLQCKYDVTTCSEAASALNTLREKMGYFDLVISDVHMPDMDGFRLLELVGLEMDIPVIMMSGDSRTDIVMRGIKHGACDYLLKPVRLEELKNIWQHVLRKRIHGCKDTENSGSMDDSDRRKHILPNDNDNASPIDDGADGNWKPQKKRKDAKEEDGELDSADPSSKKPRVVWSVELHQKFVNAVGHLGIDKAVPKKILELMNVPGITRENVASHLQKFRLYLKRINGIDRQHAGFPSPICVPGGAAGVKVGPRGRLDFQAMASSGQISSQTLAALQDELLGRPSSSFMMSSVDQPGLHEPLTQGPKNTLLGKQITFGQPLMKGQADMQTAIGGIPTFQSWSGGQIGLGESSGSKIGANNVGVVGNSQNGSIFLQPLQQNQQQLNPAVAEAICPFDIKPAEMLIPSMQDIVQPDENPILLDRENVVMPSHAIPPSLKQESALISSGSPMGNLYSTSTSDRVNQVSRNQLLVSSEGHKSSLPLSQGFPSLQAGRVGPAREEITPANRTSSFFNPFLANQSSSSLIPRPTVNLQFEHNVPALINCSAGLLVSSHSSNASFGLVQPVDDRNTHWPVNSYGQGDVPNLRESPVSNLSSFESSNAGSVLPKQERASRLGFVGKGMFIPSRFGVDDLESPSSHSTRY